MTLNIFNNLYHQVFLYFFLGGLVPQEYQSNDYQLQVKYEMQLNFDGHKTFHADLYQGPDHALFLYQLDQGAVEPQLVANDSIEASFHFELIDNKQYSILSDRRERRILQLEQIPGSDQFCVVDEPLKTVEWHFSGNVKDIQGFQCLEAKGQFAGRNYTVWFAENIPSFFGPWKLHGLPGLILEAFDESGEVLFHAVSVKNRRKEEAAPIDPMAEGSYELINRTEYTKRFNEYIEKIQKRLMTKFDRGYQVKVTSLPIKSIEIYDQ